MGILQSRINKAVMGSLLLCSSSIAVADDHIEGPYLGVFAEYFNAEWENLRDANGVSLDDGYGVGVEFGYRFSELWGARLEYVNNQIDYAQGTDSADLERFGVDALYYIEDTPLYAAVGLKNIDSLTDFNALSVGLGYQIPVYKKLNLTAEATWYEGIDRGFTDYGIKLGFRYVFGEKAAEPVIEPVKPAAPVVVQKLDSDNDGVLDEIDLCPNTAETDAVDGKGCTLFEEQSVVVNLLVTFANDDSTVGNRFFKDINEVAEYLNRFPSSDVTLEGHTSALGSNEYNLALSERRAQAVADILVNEHNISSDRITTVGYGETRLKNQAEPGSAENRRVEAFVTYTEKVKVKR